MTTTDPRPLDLAAIEERVMGNARAAELRAASAAALHSNELPPPRRGELSPLVESAAKVLDGLLPRRYVHAVPSLPETWAWLDGCEDGAGLLLSGPTGTGKTHEAYGAIRAWAAAGHAAHASVRYGNAADLLDACRPGGSSSVDELADCGLLLVDDLGAFKATEWTAEVLYRVIDRRWAEMRPTLATTNLPTSELRTALGDRLASRLAATMSLLPMLGADQRRSHR